MKALVEIKLNKNISAAEISEKTYEDVIDQILSDNGYDLTDVSVFAGVQPKYELFSETNLKNATFVSIVLELEEDQIKDFENYERLIIEKALEALGTTYLKIIDITKGDDPTSLFFNNDNDDNY
jgi:predicted subunit of tRNA(5-methylaminomethyl-2-thiouridylate) methyltransferase